MCEFCNDPSCKGILGISELLSSLIPSLLSSRLGLPMGISGNVTTIGIGSDGEVIRTYRGTKTETIKLQDIEDIDPAVALSFDAFHSLAKEISSKKKEARDLQKAAEKLKDELNGRRIDLRFALSNLLLTEHSEKFGKVGLILQKAGEGKFILFFEGDDLCDLNSDNEGMQSLFDEQEAIDLDAEKVEKDFSTADSLLVQVGSLPELLERKEKVVMELFEKHVVSKFKTDDVISIGVRFSRDDELVIIIERSVKENGDNISDEEKAIMVASINLAISRGDGEKFPPHVLEAVGITPQVEVTGTKAHCNIIQAKRQGL